MKEKNYYGIANSTVRSITRNRRGKNLFFNRFEATQFMEHIGYIIYVSSSR